MKQPPLPQQPITAFHIDRRCGAKWDLYAVEWPVKVIVCTQCHEPLRLVGYDTETHKSSYRRI